MKPAAAFSSEHYPHASVDKTAGSLGYEADGAPGEKGEGGDSMGLGTASGGDSTGGPDAGQIAKLSAFNVMHSHPAISADPDNAEGSPMPGNPTAAEGALDPYAGR